MWEGGGLSQGCWVERGNTRGIRKSVGLEEAQLGGERRSHRGWTPGEAEVLFTEQGKTVVSAWRAMKRLPEGVPKGTQRTRPP